MGYRVLLHERTFEKAADYLRALQDGDCVAGNYMQSMVDEEDWRLYTVPEFIECLLNSKRPRIFAESEVLGNGQDWNQRELSILGDITIAVPVTVYDNGLHQQPLLHDVPFEAMLLYVPGALLRNDRGNQAVDASELIEHGVISPTAYVKLYERRLLPGLLYADASARRQCKQALITIPGIGCGLFAGLFKGQLGTELRDALATILERYGEHLGHTRAVYYDPYNEAQNERREIGHISYFVRPLTMGNENKPQLCAPSVYEDEGDDFNSCLLFSFVAWDHVSWPGNDFYVGSRLTDDGVKAAATNSMAVMTGVEGSYNGETKRYEPPGNYENWLDVVRRNNCQIRVRNNLFIVTEQKKKISLQRIEGEY